MRNNTTSLSCTTPGMRPPIFRFPSAPPPSPPPQNPLLSLSLYLAFAPPPWPHPQRNLPHFFFWVALGCFCERELVVQRLCVRVHPGCALPSSFFFSPPPLGPARFHFTFFCTSDLSRGSYPTPLYYYPPSPLLPSQSPIPRTLLIQKKYPAWAQRAAHHLPTPVPLPFLGWPSLYLSASSCTPHTKSTHSVEGRRRKKEEEEENKLKPIRLTKKEVTPPPPPPPAPKWPSLPTPTRRW